MDAWPLDDKIPSARRGRRFLLDSHTLHFHGRSLASPWERLLLEAGKRMRRISVNWRTCAKKTPHVCQLADMRQKNTACLPTGGHAPKKRRMSANWRTCENHLFGPDFLTNLRSDCRLPVKTEKLMPPGSLKGPGRMSFLFCTTTAKAPRLKPLCLILVPYKSCGMLTRSSRCVSVPFICNILGRIRGRWDSCFRVWRCNE